MKNKRIIAKCTAASIAFLFMAQLSLGNYMMKATASSDVTTDVQGDGDIYHVMRLAKDKVSDNLLGNWSGWGKGYTQETIASHDGTQKSVYKAVTPTSTDESGLSQTLTNLSEGAYTLGGWSKANNVTRGIGTEYFSYSLMACIYYKDGGNESFHTSFALGTHDWEYQEISFTVNRPVNSITVYAFLRAPVYGEALFDDITFVKGTEESTSTFQDQTVQVLQTAPNQSTKTTLKTKDGLEMGLGDSLVTSLKIGGTEIANNAYSGFMVRDIAEKDKTGVYAFSPSAGSSPAAFEGTQSSLGLSISADYTAKDNHIAVSGVIKDTTNAQDGRAVQLSYALPITASGWKWGANIQSARDIKTGATGDVYKELGEGGLPVVDWDSEARTMNPMSVIYNDDLGIAMAVSMDFPTYYELEYNGSTNQYVLNYHLGIVPEAADAARFEFIIYRIDDPKWGLRSAMEKYAHIFPEYYEVREKDQGLWVAFIKTSTIINPEDFNLKFKEDDGDFRQEGYYEYEHKIKGFSYIEPGDWWLPEMEAFTEDAVYKAIADQAKQDESIKATRQAIATDFCKSLDPSGNLTWNPVNVPWALNGAQVSINANPNLPGKYNFYNLYLSDQQCKILFDPKEAISFPFDGIYLDELSGWWLGNANFNKEHYQYTTVPLTYSPYYKKPMLHRASTTWEFVKKLSDTLHGQGKTIFSNKCPDKNSFNTPLVDVMGTESTAMNGTSYEPQSIDRLSMWRSLSYQKPFCILLSNNYDQFDHSMMDKYFQRCLAFGIFPSPCGSYSDNLQYFTSRNLYYERDRDIFKKYMPTLKKIAQAGWEPVTKAEHDNKNVLIERFGENADEGVYFTVYNNTDQAQSVNVTIPVSTFDLKEGHTFKEMISGQNITFSDNQYAAQLQPNQTIVLAINNPQKENSVESSTTTTNKDKATISDNHPDIRTGESSSAVLPCIAVMAAVTVVGRVLFNKKSKRK